MDRVGKQETDGVSVILPYKETKGVLSHSIFSPS